MCDDFIYDSKVDEMHLAAVVSAEEKQTKFQGAFVYISVPFLQLIIIYSV
jgi:hypothetical protein